MSGHLGERLTPLVDGQLGHDDRDRALAHIARCPECQADVAEQRLIKSRLARLGEPPLPSGLTANLLSLGAREYRAAPPVPPPPPPAPLRIPAMASGFVAGRTERARGQRITPHPKHSSPERSSPERPDLEPAGLGPADPELSGLEPSGREYSAPGYRSGDVPARDARLWVRPSGPVRLVRPREPMIRPGPAAGRPPGTGPAWSGAPSHPGQGGPSCGASAPGRRPVRAARPSHHGRMRRTLVGSAAFMLLAVSGAALADGRAASRPSGPATIIPTVVTAIPAKAPYASVPRPVPMIASASFPRP